MNLHSACMFRGEAVDYLWSCCHNYEGMEVLEEYTEILSVGKACEAVSAYMSDETVFKINRIELIYETGFIVKPETQIYEATRCTPIYQFTCGNPQVSGYKVLYFHVNAVDGTVSVYAMK